MNQWEKLSESLQKEKTIMGYRNTPENLEKNYSAGTATIKISAGEIISFGALWPTDDCFWLEAGSIWVAEKFRGKKYSSEIFHDLITNKIPQNKKTFVITHSVSKMIHLLKKESFIEIPAKQWDEKVPFTVTCQPCDEEMKEKCLLKGNECKLFYLPK